MPVTLRDAQHRVDLWVLKIFGERIRNDLLERNFRFLEEALELTQAQNLTREQALSIVDYVYNRPQGQPKQEIGGTFITLLALCNAAGISVHAAFEDELQRCWTNIDKIRVKALNKANHIVGPSVSGQE